MKNTIAFCGSNSSQSINRKLIRYAASKIAESKVIELTDYDFPMYGIDSETKEGIPTDITKLAKLCQWAESVIIATPEHNGYMPAYFKNILDWLSRTGVKYLENTNVVVLSTSPGRGAGKNGAASVEKIIGYAGANVVGRFNLPSFQENFDDANNCISAPELDQKLKEELNKL